MSSLGAEKPLKFSCELSPEPMTSAAMRADIQRPPSLLPCSSFGERLQLQVLTLADE